jgi:hypothetical protein
MPSKYQFLYSKVPMLSMIEGQILVGASGAVTTASGAGVQGVTKLATGIYAIRVQDNFNAFIGADFSVQAPVSALAAVTAGSFVTGTLYQIVTLGTTVYSAVGLASGITQAVGQLFVATGAGSGTGTAKAIGYSDCDMISLAFNQQLMLQSSVAGLGAVVIFQNYQNSAASFTGDTASNTTISTVSSFAGLEVGQAISGAGIPLGTVISAVGATTLTISAAATATASTVPMSASPAKILAHPASGSVIRFNLFFRNSSNTY